MRNVREKNGEFRPLVSIVIPVYNGSNYLHEAIDSALAQTYDNLEIIVVNDGSADDGATEAIALSYGEKIHYFAKENGGTSTALNLGIQHMKGEYFSWLSHDDMYYPNKIKRQIEELSKLADKNTIMMSDLDGIDENYKKIYKTNYIAHVQAYPPRANSMIHPIIYNQTHGCTLLIPKACFDVVGLFDEKERVAQDFEFFYRAFSAFPHKLIPEILVTARDSSNRQGIRSKSQGDVEYSRLFIKMIENLSEEEYSLLAPSKVDFFVDMRGFFEAAEYSIALKYINSKYFGNLQISSYDLIGSRFNGNELHLHLRKYGIDSKQLVLKKQSNDVNTFEFNFNAPNSSKMLLQQSLFLNAEIVHMHLIHNIIDVNYFPLISRLKPTVLTLHDPFFLGGHCIHHFDCDKWQTHCADCHYLDNEFRLLSDTSALNYAMKKEAIQNSQISAIVASQWLKDKVEKSPVWKGKKVFYLPFGIDTNHFKPDDSKEIRKNLGIDEDAIVVLFRSDPGSFKGLDIIIDALKKLPNKKDIKLISVGVKGLLSELKKSYSILEYDWINDDSLMASLFQSCDIFLMPSRQETFGLMSVEAMACGKMVLAIEGEGTALPETINSPECGLAVKEEDYAATLANLISNKSEMLERGKRSADYARTKYSMETYIQNMIGIYKEVISDKQTDEETELLLQQLKKYTNDSFMLIGSGVLGGQSSFLRRAVVKTVRFGARIAWKCVELLHLKSFVQSTKLYMILKEKGMIDRLRW